MEEFEVKINHTPARYKANTLMELVSKNGKADANCVAITFRNQGNVAVRVGSVLLQPGAFFSDAGNPDTLNTSTFDIVFVLDETVQNPVQELLILRKFIVMQESTVG